MAGEIRCFPLLALSTYSVKVALLQLFKVPKFSFLKIEGKKIKKLIAKTTDNLKALVKNSH